MSSLLFLTNMRQFEVGSLEGPGIRQHLPNGYQWMSSAGMS